MKLDLKSLFLILVILIGTYNLYFFLLPSVTIVNHAEKTIHNVHVALPSSNLNFGKLEVLAKNTIYYDPSQKDGSYDYTVTFENGEITSGKCGQTTANQFNKRVTLTINAHNVICDNAN